MGARPIAMSDLNPDEPELIDLCHLGRARVIGTWRVGDVLIDPGPASCVARLAPALEQRPPRVLALTHIHLDHAGATGTLLRRFPEAEVWVHERGARHLADPARLLDSATRLYGDQMDTLWGEFLPVPAERIRVLTGGEELGAFRVAYTPGHASHHVSYLHEPSGHAFTGDVAGVRIGDGPTLPPTPPPDIDLAAWRASLDVIEAWRPRTLAVTHFGGYSDVSAHLDALRACLEEVQSMAETLGEAGFTAGIRSRIRGSTDAETAACYEQAVSPEQGYAGLRRHLRRLAESGPA